MNILYKRNTNGSVQQWQIFNLGDSYYTLSGRKDGKLIESAPTACTPKNLGKSNETSSAEQCKLEIAALYEKKLKEGYVSDLNELDNVDRLNPMLAKSYDDFKHKIKFPVISSEKLDGIRCNALEGKLLSRENREFVSCPHILVALQPLFDEYPEYVFDGELFNQELKRDFNKIVSLVKKQKPKSSDLVESANLINFYIFDIFRKDKQETMPAILRKKLIAEIVTKLNHPNIIALGYTVCNNQAELDIAYEGYLATEAEGQMINAYAGTYQHKRTDLLIKRKEFIDEEFEVLDVVHGEGRNAECAKLILKCENGTFDANVVGTLEYAKQVYKDKEKYLGKQATIRFQGYTPEKKPRFCRAIAFRDYE